MNIPLLPTHLKHITLTITRQCSNNLHRSLSHIEKHIIRFTITHNRYREQRLLYLLELFLSTTHTQLSNLLQSVRLTGLGSMASDRLQNLRNLTYIAGIILSHLSVENGLIFALDLTNLLLNSLDKLVHMIYLVLYLVISLQIRTNLFRLRTHPVRQPLNLHASSKRVNHHLHVLLSVLQLLHMHHHVPHLIVGTLNSVSDVPVVIHQLLHHI